jgi:hypothetical protein
LIINPIQPSKSTFLLFFRKERRFMVIDSNQLILVEPEVKRIGWGIVKFADLLEASS